MTAPPVAASMKNAVRALLMRSSIFRLWGQRVASANETGGRFILAPNRPESNRRKSRAASKNARIPNRYEDASGARRLTASGPRPYTGLVRRLHAVSTAALVALSLLSGVSVAATDDEPASLHSLIAASDLIVVGKIVRTASVERDNDLQDISYNGSRRYIAIVATLTVEETLMGDSPTGPVKFVYPKRARVKGEPVYDPEQDGVWLLRRSERANEYVADEIGRFQSRDRKEQVKAIIAKFSIKNVGEGGSDKDKEKDKPAPP